MSNWAQVVFSFLSYDQRHLLEVCRRECHAKNISLENGFSDCPIESGQYDLFALRVSDLIRASFPFIRMFHGCRPTEVSSYYKYGFRTLDTGLANEEFSRVFLNNPRLPWVNCDLIQDSIALMKNSYHREDYLYFSLDDRCLIEDCGHYLIYGSEYLQCLAVRIAGKNERDVDLARMELKRMGIPTIFIVDVPTELFSEEDLYALADSAIGEWSDSSLLHFDASRKIDHSLAVKRSLGSMYIFGHYHPSPIPDPFNQRALYFYQEY